MRNDRDLKRLRKGRDFARLADAAYTVCIKLDVVHCVGLKQFAKAEDCELMLSAGDGYATVTLQLAISACIVGYYRFFEPSEVERFEERKHALGIVQCPAHVSVAHEIEGFANYL